MKNNIKLIGFILVLMLLFQTSCDDGFGELNTDPTASVDIDPRFQFSLVQLRTSGGRYENWRAGLIYSSTMLQHMAATCGYWNGDKYTWNGDYNSSLFDRVYQETVKDLQDLIGKLESGEVGDQTMLGMARIWRAVVFHRITDLYGDVPYSEAGKGITEGIDFPKYDDQQSIYMDMLSEIEAGIGQLGADGFGEADIMFGGDTDKWKRFGYSLMLRLAMRLSEADPGTAQAWVSKAIEGGVMMDGDIAMIQHTNGPEGINMNGIGQVLDKAVGFGDDCPRLSATLVDWMTSTGDPRLDILGELPVNGGAHKGMPNGLDPTTILENPTGTSTDDFDRVNALLVSVSSPMVFMTHAETELLLAEASMRGWGAGDAAMHYENGVRSAMKLYEFYDPTLVIDEGAVNAYLAVNPFSQADGMRQIGWQHWTVNFLNEYEAFSNWRRTGFPDLTPVNYDGNVTNGQIPLRLAYPLSEAGRAQFEEARTRQGLGTDFTTFMSVPVWWDK